MGSVFYNKYYFNSYVIHVFLPLGFPNNVAFTNG